MRSEAGQGRDTAVAERERLVSVQRYVPLPADPLGGRRGSLLAVRNAPDQGNAESYHLGRESDVVFANRVGGPVRAFHHAGADER